MAQDTTWTGAVLTESDINAKLMHEDAAWTGFTPTLTQSATPTKTVTYAKYGRAARLIYGSVRLDVTGTGTAANRVVVGLPVAAGVTNISCGSGWLLDVSAALQYGFTLQMASTTTCLLVSGGAFADYLGVSSFAAALAVGDVILYTFMYEAAT